MVSTKITKARLLHNLGELGKVIENLDPRLPEYANYSNIKIQLERQIESKAASSAAGRDKLNRAIGLIYQAATRVWERQLWRQRAQNNLGELKTLDTRLARSRKDERDFREKARQLLNGQDLSRSAKRTSRANYPLHLASQSMRDLAATVA